MKPILTAGIVISSLIGGNTISHISKEIQNSLTSAKEAKIINYSNIEQEDSVFVEGDTDLYFNNINDNETLESSWKYNEVKNISINLDVSNFDSNSKYIDIILPLGMEMHTNPDSLVDNKAIIDCDSSEFNKVEIKNSSNSYIHKPRMGRVRLCLNASVKKVSLDILVSIDNILWNAVEGALSHDSSEKAIIISAGDKDSVKSYKLDRVKVVGKDWTTYNDPGTIDMAMNNTEIKTSWLSAIGFIQSTQKRYHKSAYMRMEIPNYTYVEDGVSKTKYATINSIEIEYGGTYEIIDNYIIFKWENIYEHQLKPIVYYQFDGELPSDEVDAKFNFGELYIEDYFTGEIHSLGSNRTKKIKLISNTKERIELKGSNRYVYNEIYPNRENVNSVLCGFSLWNYGANSHEKLLEIEFPSGIGSSFGATKIVLPFAKDIPSYNLEISVWNNTTGEEITKNITLSNSSKNDYYNLKLLDILPKMDISENQNDWYFKKIKYTLGRIPASWGFNVSWSIDAKGIIHGKYLGGNNQETTRVILKSKDENGIIKEDKVVEMKSMPQSKGVVTGAITSFDFYNENNQKITEIMAGENMIFKGIAEASNYGYNNSNLLPEPVFYLRLPKGITLDKDRTVFKLENSTSNGILDYSVKEPRELHDGSFLYEISFNRKDFGIGYYSNSYSSLGRISFNIYVKVTKSSKTTSINARDTLFLVDNKVDVVGGGWWDSYVVKDKFDLNNNGITTDSLSTSRYDLYLNINASTSWLEVYSSSEGSSSLGDISDVVKYKLLINNTNDGIVRKGDMEYYIPIPKKDIEYNEYVKENGKPFNFDVELVSRVEHIPGFEILYSYDTINFEPDSENLNLNKVAMIKIVNEKEILPGDSLEFNINMKYSEDSWNGNENSNSWNVYGYQTYEKNGTESSYLHVLDTFKVELILNPKILKNPESKTVKVGESVAFSTNIDVGIPVATGNWQCRDSYNGNWIDLNETSTTLFIDNVSYNLNGYEYRYIVTNKGATVESLPATLTVIDNEGPIITLNEFKDGDVYKITITAIDNGSGISHIILPDGSRVNSNTYTMIADVNTEYTFKVYDLAGNESTKSTMIGVLVSKNVTSNLDVYIKSNNMLSLSLDTNSIVFSDFSGVEDVEKQNAINMTVNSSLPYKVNAYLVSEIQNSDKSRTMDKSILNIKANNESTYNVFTDVLNPITLLNNQMSGNNIQIGIDIKLKSNIAHKKDVYKTVIKFEIEQK